MGGGGGGAKALRKTLQGGVRIVNSIQFKIPKGGGGGEGGGGHKVSKGIPLLTSPK